MPAGRLRTRPAWPSYNTVSPRRRRPVGRRTACPILEDSCVSASPPSFSPPPLRPRSLPVRATPTAAATADLNKYLPDGAGFYVHINVQQFLAAPVVRKAIPMAVDKYGDRSCQLVQMAKAFDPNAANIPEDKIKKGIDELKKPETIAKAFDAAKDVVTDIVVAGDPGDEEQVRGRHQVPRGRQRRTWSRASPRCCRATRRSKIKMHEKGKATIYEVQVPQQPQPIVLRAARRPGVVCIGMSKESWSKRPPRAAARRRR